MSVTSLALVGLLQEVIVVHWLPLNKAHNIFRYILSILFSNFKVWWLRSLPVPFLTALMEFFYTDAETNVHLLPVSWYLFYFLFTMIVSMFLYAYDVDIMLGCWQSQLRWHKLLMLNVTMLTMFLPLINFGLSLSSVVDFLKTGAQAPTSTECIPCLPAAQWMMSFGHILWIRIMVIFHWLFYYQPTDF